MLDDARLDSRARKKLEDTSDPARSPGLPSSWLKKVVMEIPAFWLLFARGFWSSRIQIREHASVLDEAVASANELPTATVTAVAVV